MNQILFVDDTALVADLEAYLHQLVNEIGRVCRRTKLSWSVSKLGVRGGGFLT